VIPRGENMMKKTLLAVLALAALTAACHERREDASDYGGVRARSEASHDGLDAQQPPAEK